MINWAKYGKRVGPEGTTVFYQGQGTNLTIESRRRHIPHANGSGTWDHTTYWVLRDGVELREKYSLADAKEYAEEVEGCRTTARPVDGTTSQETDDTAEDVPLPVTSGSPPRARIRISVDRLPPAPEPTLPHRRREKVDTFTLSWGQEQLRRKVITSERQKKWRRNRDKG